MFSDILQTVIPSLSGKLSFLLPIFAFFLLMYAFDFVMDILRMPLDIIKWFLGRR